jgi:hypothetical protein
MQFISTSIIITFEKEIFKSYNGISLRFLIFRGNKIFFCHFCVKQKFNQNISKLCNNNPILKIQRNGSTQNIHVITLHFKKKFSNFSEKLIFFFDILS